MEEFIRRIKQKAKLANAKAVMCFTAKVRNEKEGEWYLGYRQAIEDIVKGLNGGRYEFTEYDDSRHVLDNIDEGGKQ